MWKVSLRKADAARIIEITFVMLSIEYRFQSNYTVQAVDKFFLQVFFRLKDNILHEIALGEFDDFFSEKSSFSFACAFLSLALWRRWSFIEVLSVNW